MSPATVQPEPPQNLLYRVAVRVDHVVLPKACRGATGLKRERRCSMKLAGSQYTRVGPDFPEGKTWILASVAKGKPEKDPVSVVQWKQKMRGSEVSGVLKEDFRMGEDLERMWEINLGPLATRHPQDRYREIRQIARSNIGVQPVTPRKWCVEVVLCNCC